MKNSRIRHVGGLVLLCALATCGGDSAAPTTNGGNNNGNTTPSQLLLVSGNNQTGDVNANLAAPIVVKVVNAQGTGLSGVTVNYATTSGSFTAPTQQTDASGQAQNTWKLGATAGTFSATISVAGVTQTLSINATAKAPVVAQVASVTLGSTTLVSAIPVGSTSPTTYVATAKDAAGNPVAGATVTFTASGNGSVTTSGGTTTNSAGQVQAQWKLGTLAGQQTLTAAVGTVTSTPMTVSALAGPFARIRSARDTVRLVTASDTFSLVSVDQYDNAVGAQSWTIVDGTVASSVIGSVVGQRLVTALKTGSTRIIATSGTTADTANIVVMAAPPSARKTRAYNVNLAGTPNSSLTWTVASGSLPPGVSLSTQGTLSGTPTTTGTYNATLRVTAGTAKADRAVAMYVCDGVLTLNVGQSSVARYPDQCAVVLPSASNQKYRVALMPRRYVYNSNGNEVTAVSGGLKLRATVETPSGALVETPVVQRIQGRPAVLGGELLAKVEDDRMHEQMWNAGGRFAGVHQVAGPALAPSAAQFAADSFPQTRVFKVGSSDSVTARLRYVGTNLVLYEAVNVEATHTDAEIQQAFAKYDTYGKGIIETYFGGLGPNGSTNWWKSGARSTTDLDGNGHMIVLQLPTAMSVPGAFVSDYDRWPRPANASSTFPTSSTYSLNTQSNEGEVIYTKYGTSTSWNTLVHEAKHISSLGYTYFANKGREDFWLEEGFAMYAQELSVRGEANVSETAVINALTGLDGMINVVQTAMLFLNAAPTNGIIGNPNPNILNSTCYGSGWLFWNFILDNYADALGGRAALAKRFNTTASSYTALQGILGKPWSTLITDWAAAISAEGFPTAKAALPYRFKTFNFANIEFGSVPNQSVSTTWPFALRGTYNYSTVDADVSAYNTSLTLFDFNSNTSGDQRLDVLATSGEPVSVANDVVLVVTRIQ